MFVVMLRERNFDVHSLRLLDAREEEEEQRESDARSRAMIWQKKLERFPSSFDGLLGEGDEPLSNFTVLLLFLCC